MATEAQMEILNDAHQAWLRMGDFETCDDPRAWIRASNIMLDAAIDAGMPYDYPDHAGWTATAVTGWLLSA